MTATYQYIVVAKHDGGYPSKTVLPAWASDEAARRIMAAFAQPGVRVWLERYDITKCGPGSIRQVSDDGLAWRAKGKERTRVRWCYSLRVQERGETSARCLPAGTSLRGAQGYLWSKKRILDLKEEDGEACLVRWQDVQSPVFERTYDGLRWFPEVNQPPPAHVE